MSWTTPPFPEPLRRLAMVFRGKRETAGFTLLELLLVVTILSAVAWMALGVVNNNGDQMHFDETRNRLQTLRRAIIGDPSRTVNGGPEIRGYVADMGGLPENINALIAQKYCRTPENSSDREDEVIREKICVKKFDKTECESAGCEWVTQTSYQPPDATGNYGLGYGWNGPYITAAEYSGYPRLQDGWGNQAGAGLHTGTNERDSDRNSFGWVFHQVRETSSDNIHLAVRSLGKNGIEDDYSDPGVPFYDADYPPQYVPEQDNAGGTPPWKVDVETPESQWLINDRDYRMKVTEADDGKGTLTISLGSPSPCWRCSNSAHNSSRKDCEDNAGKWLNLAGINEEAPCVNATNNGKWIPLDVGENLCMAIAYRELQHSTSDPFATTVAIKVKKSTNSSTVNWDGTTKYATFPFVSAGSTDDFYLPLGSFAYRIYQKGETTTCQTTDPPHDDVNATEAEYWHTLILVPGSGIQ